MRLHRSLVALALMALIALAMPSAVGHVDTATTSRNLALGPYTAFLEPEPTPLFANASNQGFRLQVVRSDIGGTATDAKAKLQLAGPGGFHDVIAFSDVDRRYKIATTTFPLPGNYSARLIVEGDQGEHFASTEFEVFPDLPFRLEAIDPTQDITPGARTTLAFESVDPIGRNRIDAFPSLTVLVEHYSPDHLTLLSTEEVQAMRTGVGLWKVEHIFPSEGHYYLRFASVAAGFNYADVPLAHINAYAPMPVAEDPKASPGLAPLVLTVLVGALALAVGRRHV